MPRLPVLSGEQTVRNFERFGWDVARQRGSHIVMTKPGEIATLSVPDHSTVAKGTLRSLIRDAGLTVAEFCATL
ncbi:MAG: type II toxin-antitoxin system HicA family toxin [Chloroflexota bacterium]|nr:type II toxin-antitoxin system HicA family toxin [Chloroflexota bacterium]MDE2959401.1 type II toxin-antitoxin system HicA family toxin [Chloroflexota bacterium]